MDFKQLTKFYLSEAVRKVDDVRLLKGIGVNDVILGWSKIKNPTQWEKITETEFINYINIYIGDHSKRDRLRKEKSLIENFSTEDFKKAYTKFRAIIADEKSLKKGQPVNFATLRGELDRNPGKPENMILNIFFNFAAEEAKKGRTSRSHMDALKANAE